MLLSLVLILLGIFIAMNIVHVVVRNTIAHQFFKKYSRNIPVLENPELFAGHIRMGLDPKNWLHISNLHKKYGKNFGYYYTNQAWVSTIDIDLIKKVASDNGNLHINRQDCLFPFVEFNESIMQTREDVWRRSRKALAPTLTSHRLTSEDTLGAIKNPINKTIKRLEGKIRESYKQTGDASVIVVVNDMVSRIALSVILSIAYRKDDIIDFESDKEHWVEFIHDGLSDTKNIMVVLGVIFPMFRPIREFAIKFSNLGKMQTKVRQWVQQVFKEHKSKLIKEKAQRTDEDTFKMRMVDSAIEAYLDRKMTYRDVVGNMFGMFLAGYVTTADTMTCFLWLMAFHPEIQEKLRKSLEKEGVDSEYLQWCILECVRLYPAVPLGIGRELKTDIEHNGMLLPKGCFVQPAVKTIHHCEDIWFEASKFKPERWEKRADFHPAAFMGFGVGPRNCPGRMLAQLEIRMTMSEIITTYRIEKCSQTVESLNISSPIMFHTMMDDEIFLKFVPVSGY